MRFTAFWMIASLASCSQPETDTPPPALDRRAVMAKEIERAVGAKLLDIDIARYSRHYAATENGQIMAVYLRECGKEVAGCADAKTIWTTSDKLPFVMDGGCGVVMVAYDPQTGTLINAACNGEA